MVLIFQPTRHGLLLCKDMGLFSGNGLFILEALGHGEHMHPVPPHPVPGTFAPLCASFICPVRMRAHLPLLSVPYDLCTLAPFLCPVRTRAHLPLFFPFFLFFAGDIPQAR